MLKGALHVHSTYSDGERSLRELRELFLAEGFRFVCLSDHAEAFDDAKIADYNAECALLSDENFILVPGLEFACERRLHVIGYGYTQRSASTNPEIVLRQLNEAGAVSVIAHPQDVTFDWIESFTTLPRGLEVWNTKYDGRFAPRAGTFRLLHRLQQRQPDLLAFYGLDLHWQNQDHSLFVEVDCNLSVHGVLSALKAGRFHAVKGNRTFPSRGAIADADLASFHRVHRRYDLFKRVLRAVNHLRVRVGADIPRPLKAQLRRLF